MSITSPSSTSNENENDCSSVQVAVRVRPLNENEKKQGSGQCVNAMSQTILLGSSLSNSKQYDFDAVFPPRIAQQQVYLQLMRPLVERFFDGYNATVFAYGQTGSGKTFTMGNEFKMSVLPENRGIIPRVMEEVFEHIENESNNSEFVLKLSYLEILNEEIYDLLSPSGTSSTSNSLSVRDDGKRGIIVAGLSEHQVRSLEDVAALLHAGAMNRATASTSMNAQSSRSHAICTLSMEQFSITGMESRYSKFHLVDLAGSERAKRTNAEGARFKEGININKGLLCLGNVINALSERSNNSTIHVPYRDSKLTRLLQDSLGGNSKTLMIACVSPAEINLEESKNTLRYASRAKKIQNQAVINKEMNEFHLMKQKIELLELQLLQAKSGNSSSITTSNTSSSIQVSKLNEKLESQEKDLQILFSIKEKWKQLVMEIGPQMMSKQKNSLSTSSSTSSTGLNLMALEEKIQEMLEFESTLAFDLDKFNSITPPDQETTATEEDQENQEDQEDQEDQGDEIRLEIENLAEVIEEKEKIMAFLSQEEPSTEEEEENQSPNTTKTKTSTSTSMNASKNVEEQITTKRLLKLRQKYEKKIVKLEEKIFQLTKGEDTKEELKKVKQQLLIAKKAQQECTRLTNLHTKGLLKISSLQKEILTMKQQKVGLMKTLKEKNQLYQMEKNSYKKQLVQIEKSNNLQQKQMLQLQTKHQKTNLILKRKTEELALFQKKLKTMMSFNHHHSKTKSSSSPVGIPTGSTKGNNNKTFSMLQMEQIVAKYFEIYLTIGNAKKAIENELKERQVLALQVSRGNKEDRELIQMELKEKNQLIDDLKSKLSKVEEHLSINQYIVHQEDQIQIHCFSSSSSSSSSSSQGRQVQKPMELFSEQNEKCHVLIDILLWKMVEKEMLKQKEIEEIIAVQEDSTRISTRTSTSSTSSTINPQQSVSELQKELDTVRKELKEIKTLQQQVTTSTDSTTKKNTKKKTKTTTSSTTIFLDDEEEDLFDDEDEEEEEEEDDDSDYVEEEEEEEEARKIKKAHQKKKTGRRHSRDSIHTITTINTTQKSTSSPVQKNYMTEIDDLLSMDSSSSLSNGNVPKCCTCHGKCATKACACKAFKNECGPECGCDITKCRNRKGWKETEQEMEDKENVPMNILLTPSSSSSSSCTQKKRKLNQDAKEKENLVEYFFANDDKEEDTSIKKQKTTLLTSSSSPLKISNPVTVKKTTSATAGQLKTQLKRLYNAKKMSHPHLTSGFKPPTTAGNSNGSTINTTKTTTTTTTYGVGRFF